MVSLKMAPLVGPSCIFNQGAGSFQMVLRLHRIVELVCTFFLSQRINYLDTVYILCFESEV